MAALTIEDPLGPERLLAELQGCLSPGLLAQLRQVWQQQPDLQACVSSHERLLWMRAGERVQVPGAALAMPGRLDPLLRLTAMAGCLPPWRTGGRALALQVHDEEPAEALALRVDAPAGAARPDQGVIPDPYCLGSRGYLLFRQAYAAMPPPPWPQRRPLAIWRGTTTGSRAITPQRLPQNPRYRLCSHSLRWPDRLDARFSSVVQCRDGEAQRAVTAQLQREGLMASLLEPLEMAQCRWIVDMDGNVNSWGLLWKLLSGSCVLRVSSDRGQWFHHRLQPWRHLVPIRADLADLEQQLDWCFANPAACAAIADAGQRLALEVLDDLGVDLLSALRWSLR
jgi:hypothetical protein